MLDTPWIYIQQRMYGPLGISINEKAKTIFHTQIITFSSSATEYLDQDFYQDGIE